MRKVYDFHESPLKVYGVPFFDKTKKMERLPEELRKKLSKDYPDLDFLGRRVPGARICFRTDSPSVTVKIAFSTFTVDEGMSIYACQSANVLIGERRTARYAGMISPLDYNTFIFENTIEKDSRMEDVTIFLPRNEIIEKVEIGVEADARIEEPTPYRYDVPVLFFGSSITEGGCCTRVTNAYNALLSNRLDFDYFNFGFSGNAAGQLTIAEYINTIKMSAFVYDYDHNAPNPEHLAATHEPFFQCIREKNPELPILILTKPDFDYDPDGDVRRNIIKKTYLNAIENGDKNVYFIDGETYFGTSDRHCCTVDRCHPNDLGFMRMADTMEPVIRKMLGMEISGAL